MKNNDLTILLTLKGRHLHTLRWLWHANRIKLPFHVIVADGEVHPTIDRLLSDPQTFPNLSFEYHKYEDKSFRDFYYKCADALGKVRTPYVKMSDNDDFLFPFGLNKSAAFLDSDPEYVCAGGGIPGFSIDERSNMAPNVAGLLRRIRYRYIQNDWYRCRDIDDTSVTDRVLGLIRNPLVIYYNVYRTQALRTITNEIFTCNISFQMLESYWGLRTVTIGKVKSDPSYFSYFRQSGTSSNPNLKKDWIDYLLNSRFTQSFETMISRISYDAALIDGCDQAGINEQIYQAFAASLRVTLACTMMRYRFPRLFALKQRFLSLPLLHLMPALLQRRLDQKKIWKYLAADGADSSTLTAHKMELEDIMATLQGDEFIKFVSSNAPDLLQLRGRTDCGSE